jgi:hypothetical protein
MRKLLPVILLFCLNASLAVAQNSSGLVAGYGFNAGSTFDVITGNPAPALGATQTDDRFAANSALSFAGTGYVNCGNTGLISGLTKSFSISVWFNRAAASSGIECLVSKWMTTPASEHFLLGVSGSQIIFATAGPGNQGITAGAYTMNTWNHVVLTWQSNGAHNVYLNNVLIKTSNLAAHTVNATAPVAMMIGAMNTTSRRFIGKIDDVLIYDHALVAEEVSVLYNLSPAKSEQTISFSTIGTLLPTDDDFTLQATASSALPVTFASSNPGIIAVNGTTAELVGTSGRVTLNAIQAGDGTRNGVFARQTLLLKTAQTITFGELPAKTFGDANFNLEGTSSSLLGVSYTSSDPNVATVSGSTVTIHGAGTTNITATQAGNDIFGPATEVVRELVVNKKDQTLTFAALPAVEPGTPAVSLVASATSNLPVTFTSSDNTVAEISGTTVVPVGQGTATITATQPGNANYNPAPAIERSFTVALTDGLVANYSFDNGNANDDALGNHGTPANAATAADRFEVADRAYLFNGFASIQCGNTNVIKGLTTSFSLSAWIKRSVASTGIEVIVSKWANSPSADHFLLGVSGNKIIFATGGPGLNGLTTTATFTMNQWHHVVATWNSSGQHRVYIDNVQVMDTKLGAHVINVSSPTNMTIGAQNPSFRRFAGYIDDVRIYRRAIGAVEVSTLFNNDPAKASQTIDFPVIGSKYVSDPDFTPVATSSSALPVAFTSSNSDILSFSDNVASIHAVGQVTVTAVQTGNDEFNGQFVQQVVTVSKGLQTIDAESIPANLTFSEDDITLPANTSGGLPIIYTSSQPTVATLSGNVLTLVAAGTTTITASQEGDANYDPVEVSKVLTVVKAAQTISLEALPDRQFGDSSFELPASTSAGLPVSYSSSDPNVATVAGVVVTLHGVGMTMITGSHAGDDRYLPADDVSQTLNVAKGDQEVFVDASVERLATDDPYDLPAVTSVEIAMSYSSSNTAVATISGNTVTIVGAGTTDIVGTSTASDLYNTVTVTQVLTVSKAAQTITFMAIAAKTMGDASFELVAESNSGLAVSFSTADSEVSITGSTVTISAAGSVTITATQAGNEKYLPAESMEQVFCVKPPQPTITGNLTDPTSPILTSSASAGNQWYKSGGMLEGATGVTFMPTTGGVYSVTAAVEGCASVPSSGFTLLVTEVTREDMSSQLVYPNPAGDRVTISLSGLRGDKVVTIRRLDGGELFNINTQAGELEVDTRSFAAGVCVVMMSDSYGTRRVVRLIKH